MSSRIDSNNVSSPPPADGQNHFMNSRFPTQNFKFVQQQQVFPVSRQLSQDPSKVECDGITLPVNNSNISKYLPPQVMAAGVNNRITNGPNQNSVTSNGCNMNVKNAVTTTTSSFATSQSLGGVGAASTSMQTHQQNIPQGPGKLMIPTVLMAPQANPSIQSIDKNLRNLNLTCSTNGDTEMVNSTPSFSATSSQTSYNFINYQIMPLQASDFNSRPAERPPFANTPRYEVSSTREIYPTRSNTAPNAINQQPVSTTQENYLSNNSVQQQCVTQRDTAEMANPMESSATRSTQHNQPTTFNFRAQQPHNYKGTVGTRPLIPSGITQYSPLQYQCQNPVYPQPQCEQQSYMYPYQHGGGSGSILQSGFNRLWGMDTIDLLQNRRILSPVTLQAPKIVLHNQLHDAINCNPNVLRCTLTKIPESNSLLQKSRLPLGIVIHPFRDINSLPVIQCPNIVRCRLCRTYINPFVYFADSKMWKCNLCYRMNELSEEFQFDPVTKTYGDVTRRPEVRSSTIEFIASSEYMLRPPQPAIYLFIFDVSIIAQQCGYLENICNTLSNYLDEMPGGARTQVGFIAFNSQIHFYSMAEGYNQPHEITLLDIDDPFLPRPDNLLVNLNECKELVRDLLKQLPKRFADIHDPGSAMGAALMVAYKLMQSTGGRVTLFQTCLPNKGPGSLLPRENPNDRSGKDVAHLNPATDYYKRYALECSAYQIAVDLFLLNQQFSDLATISGISKHSGGCIHHFPLYQHTKQQMVDSLTNCFKRYLVRKIGFEAVMRIRCTRGLQVHTFHGNFFVRSTDLLSLPNVNPDAGYGMQISYEENLSDVRSVCFQAALLYTNSEGERRIRVHTLCLPVSSSLPEIMHSADTQAIVSLLSKMAVDRSLNSSVNDAREAFINVTVDIFNAFKIAQNIPTAQSGDLLAPRSLALLPLYILALLKHPAFRVGACTRLDDRLFAMDCMKTLPLDHLMKIIYPEFYNVDALFFKKIDSTKQYPNSNNIYDNKQENDDEEGELPELTRLHLSAEVLDSRSMYLMDCGPLIMIYVGLNVPPYILQKVFDVDCTAELQDYMYGLPRIANSMESSQLERFLFKLNDEKPYAPTIQIIRDTSAARPQFMERLVDDRSESSLSYYEFLQHIQAQVK